MNNARLFTDFNITPIFFPNPLWANDGANGGAGSDPDKRGNPKWLQNLPVSDYMRARGFEFAPMVYEGTLNRSSLWSRDGLPHNNPLDWSLEENNSNPPVEKAVKACARLAANASMYGANVDDFPPIVFDLENPSVGIDLNGNWSSSLQNVYSCAKWSREVNPHSALMHYSIFPYTVGLKENDFWGSVEVKNTLDTLTHIAPSVYFWDVPAFSPNVAFDEVDEVTRALDKYCPHMPRVMIVTPYYQIYWPQNAKNPSAAAKKNGQPVASGLWRRWIKYLVDRDYHLYYWGLTSLDSPTRAAISAAVDLAYS